MENAKKTFIVSKYCISTDTTNYYEVEIEKNGIADYFIRPEKFEELKKEYNNNRKNSENIETIYSYVTLSKEDLKNYFYSESLKNVWENFGI